MATREEELVLVTMKVECEGWDTYMVIQSKILQI